METTSQGDQAARFTCSKWASTAKPPRENKGSLRICAARWLQLSHSLGTKASLFICWSGRSHGEWQPEWIPCRELNGKAPPNHQTTSQWKADIWVFVNITVPLTTKVFSWFPFHYQKGGPPLLTIPHNVGVHFVQKLLSDLEDPLARNVGSVPLESS